MLSILYGHVGESFYVRQLARRTDTALGPVQTRFDNWSDAVPRKTARADAHSANQENPPFGDQKLSYEDGRNT